MKCGENHTEWLQKMKSFCEELKLYLHNCVCDESFQIFSRYAPENTNGDFDNLCEMSTQCTYVSGIDTEEHDATIFQIQYMARRLLVEIGKHQTHNFQSDRSEPFFEKTLLIAISLAVEHQMHMGDAGGMQRYLPQAKTRCF